MDIYKQYINKNASDKSTVNMGRISAGVALAIACVMAPLLGGIDQAFQFIQEYTGVLEKNNQQSRNCRGFGFHTNCHVF